MKKIFNNKKWYSLVELSVIIAVITIIAIWASRINFNRLSSKQKLDIFSNKIISKIETTRNNALLWKWIWTNLVIPNKWKIEISSNNSWTINSSYYDWTNWYLYNEDSLIVTSPFYINNIRCSSLTGVISNLSWTTWSIFISWWDLSLSWCTNTNDKILELDVTFWSFRNRITINTLNWLIEKFRIF